MTQWKLDPAHSEINFSVRHMAVSRVRGSFTKWNAEVSLPGDDVAAGSASATIEVSSINTGMEQRDGHLKSPDFFDAEKFPQIQFKSTKASGKGEQFVLEGELSIRGVTKTVSFKGEAHGPAKDPWGGLRRGFHLSGKIDRRDFGLSWNQVLELGGVLVGEEVSIEADIELIAG